MSYSSSFLIVQLMNFFRKPFPLNIMIFFIFIYTFSCFRFLFKILIVLPEVKIVHSCENISQGLQDNLGLLTCKTCSYFPMAHGIIRKTPGSSPGPYNIWKKVKCSLFKQNAFPKSTFMDKHFRRDHTRRGSSSSQSLPAHLIMAQPCRLNALFLVGKSERWRLVTHHEVWGNYT